MNSANPQGPRYRQLPLWRDATRLLVLVETAVRHFAQYHKYTLGADMRRQAMGICRRVARAAQCTDATQRARQFGHLVGGVEDLKITLQVKRLLRRRGQPWCEVCENGFIRGGRKKQRQLVALWPVLPQATDLIEGTVS